jgi:hypothetical protein
MSNEHLIASIRHAIEWAALGIEILGALIIVAGVLRVTWSGRWRSNPRSATCPSWES